MGFLFSTDNATLVRATGSSMTNGMMTNKTKSITKRTSRKSIKVGYLIIYEQDVLFQTPEVTIDKG